MGKKPLDYDTREFLVTMLWLAIAVAAVLLLTYAEPVAPPLLGSVGLLYLLHRNKHPLAALTREFLWCVTTGLGIVLFCYGLVALCLAWFSTRDLTPALRSAENFISEASEKAEALSGWKPTLIICVVVIALVLLTRLLPRWQLLGRFATLRDWFSRVALVLSVVAGYTFFTADPIAKTVRGHGLALQRNTHDNQRKTLAAQALQAHVAAMDEATKTYYQVLFQDPRISGEGVAEAVAERQVEGAAPALATAQPSEATAPTATERSPVDAPPGAATAPVGTAAAPRLGDLDAQSRASAREYNATLEGTKLIFGQVLGLQSLVNGPIGDYVTGLIEDRGDVFLDKGFRWLRLTGNHDPQKDVAAASDKVLQEEVAREQKEREQELEERARDRDRTVPER
ncbi:hypothetical protein [Dinghuibacter silviterrae]|uniref:Uncharacterized protein n=1 Tax=Dinghuibacter silviterrae TaxID=1539049 RepID=A0A4R8DT07_9BACT|nr:hypothetical protein [Dinghuibacter silviterrae]TDX01414.1 hypothetical protein EDB95_2449 [Dinghuibacter silviterrae]